MYIFCLLVVMQVNLTRSEHIFTVGIKREISGLIF